MKGDARRLIARAALVVLFLAVGGCKRNTPPGSAPAGTPVPGVTWTRQFGSPAWDVAFGVAVDGTGNVFVAGATDGALSGQTNAGSWDAFVRKVSE